MFVGATGTSVTTFQATPEGAHAILCSVLKRLRALGCTTRRLGRGVYVCDADVALLVLTLAHTDLSDTYLLSGTVTGDMPSALTRKLVGCVDVGVTV